MELFDSMDSSLAEFLGVNEYELLSKQAKVSYIPIWPLKRINTALNLSPFQTSSRQDNNRTNNSNPTD